MSADLGDNSDIGWIHEYDVEHSDCEALWNFDLSGLKSTFLLDIGYVLEMILFKDETLKAIGVRSAQIFNFIGAIDELRLVHPSKASNIASLAAILLAIRVKEL